MSKKKKKALTTDEKFANAEKIIAAKELQDKADELLDKVLKKALIVKQRGLK